MKPVRHADQHGAGGAVRRVLALVLAVVLAGALGLGAVLTDGYGGLLADGGLPLGAPTAHAEDSATSRIPTLTRIADPTTFNQWEDGIGDPVSPTSTGRVWTDKSVAIRDVTLNTHGGSVTIAGPERDDEFLVGLSALSSAQKVTVVPEGAKTLASVPVLGSSGSADDATPNQPSSPIGASTESGVARGTVTITDTLGDYMDVRDVRSVVFAGRQFTQKSSHTSDGVTTYTFTGQVSGNAIYGTADLADLTIAVRHGDGADGDVVTVQVPAHLLPLRLYSATVCTDGTVATQIAYAHPIRVFYVAGLRDGVREGLTAAGTTLAKYVERHAAANGDVRFAAGTYVKDGLGTTKAQFVPSTTNSFYYLTEDTPLYNSKSTDDPATGIDEDGTYWYVRPYYADNARHEQWVQVSGADAVDVVSRDADGHWYGKAGNARFGLANYTVAKERNATGTVASSIAPRWDGNVVDVSLGNNGVIVLRGAVAPALPGDVADGAAVEDDSTLPPKPLADGTVEVPSGGVAAASREVDAGVASMASAGSEIALVVCVGTAVLGLGLWAMERVKRRSGDDVAN
ncbi:MAG: hypothetical protein UHD09_00545 [Bifidobacterium sp.]|nr:hypothetical protein [Bifidobacterium sp.]